MSPVSVPPESQNPGAMMNRRHSALWGQKDRRGAPLRILLIQLARFGDLIQTSPLIQRIRQAREDALVDLLVDERSRTAASLLDGVNEIHPLRIAHPPRPNVDDPMQWYREYRNWLLQQLPGRSFDHVVLLNQGVLPQSIASLIREGRQSGPQWGRPLPSPHRYLASIIDSREFNPIHLCELWAAYGPPGTWPLLRPKLADRTGTGFANQEVGRVVSNRKNRIFAVNVGAGAAGRRLGREIIAPLVRELLRLGAEQVLLLGTSEDGRDAGSVMQGLAEQERHRVLDFTGRTSLRDLPGLLNQAAVLISSDTGTLQLAAAVDVETIGLFFGGANPVETGSYRRNAVALYSPASSSKAFAPAVPWIARAAFERASGAKLMEDQTHVPQAFTLLVARSSPLGLQYKPLGGYKDAPVGKAGRWLPLLRQIVHDDEAGPNTGEGKPQPFGELESDEAALLQRMISGDRQAAGDGDVASWVHQTLQRMQIIEKPIV